MKNILQKFPVAFLSLLMITIMSCSKDFLNEPEPTDQVGTDVVYGSREGAEAFISGIMRRMRRQFTNVDSGGLNSMLFARTAKGNDVVIGTGWFTNDYENNNREPTYRRTTFSWRFPYYIIGQVNQFIHGVNESEALSETDKRQLLAQGRAIRGYYYHQLVLEFAPAYSVAPDFPAPPVYTELSLEGHSMSRTQEVYDLILEDLQFAIENVGTSRLDKSYINKNVAHAMLAQVYQVMGNWEDAETAANAAYGGDLSSALVSGSYANGFNDLSVGEWIWGLPQYDDQSQYYYSAPHVQTDHSVESYQNAYFNNEFVNLFSGTDIRKLFNNYYEVEKSSFRHWVTSKFAFTFDADIPIIRTAEMILIEAEAKYRNGDAGGAHDLLYAIQQNRDPKAVKSSNTGEDLLEEILLERRKELYAEIGVEWFDAKRLQRGISRSGNHRVGSSADLAPNDKKFYLKIPQSEIDANVNIDGSVNENR